MNGKQKFYFLMFLFQIFLVFTVIFVVQGIQSAVAQSTTTTSDPGNAVIGLGIGAGLAVGLAGVGAGIAIKTTGTATISFLNENESAFFKGFLIVAFGEALAIYGLIVSILLWTKIPTY